MIDNEILKDLDLLRSIVSKKVKLNQYDRGLCPFHEEDTPSFSIYLGHDRARYHCFGCGSTGDILNYIQRTEKLNFNTAVMKLKLYINNQRSSISSLPAEALAESATLKSKDEKYIDCQLNCEYCSNLEFVLRELWEENQKFRIWLNLGPFIPHNERKDTYDYL